MPIAISYPEAVKALAKWATPVEFVSVSGDPLAYWRLFVRLWADAEPFVIVEHDIVIQRDTIRQLADCPAPWCAFVYHEEVGDPVTGLGCTKIVPVRNMALDLEGFPEPIWQNVDATVAGLLHAIGRSVHEHGPSLRHLNPRVAAMQEGNSDD